ncbi:MAG: N-acetylmuramoyl-L-alanine amidase [Desulfobacter sp.]|nr:N-acetylmuramoyl-L-alanine amidase [Desulfobacter sp.]WDP86930.1 MAG: N-acetylmuramoyl-L-alanine amidase [Desulfobacter sp.]
MKKAWHHIVLLLVLMGFCSLVVGHKAVAGPAKSKYLSADGCIKRVKKSPVERQKISSWLRCINRYKDVYQLYPEDSWAPAGMFKAGELYHQLYRQSGSMAYEDRALELLTRITKKYPQSAYSGRARILKKSIGKKPSPAIKTLTSKKAKTRDDRAIALYQKELKSKLRTKHAKPVQAKSPEKKRPDPLPLARPKNIPVPLPLPKTDTRVTGLRFWSNPEYTRIVVNAEGERPYAHRLLKKDPKLNKPFQRLYVDIEKARLGNNVSEHTPINDNLLKQARAGQYKPHTVRVVVDIKAFENYKIFSLKDPFRIVIDVWGKNGQSAPMDQMQTALNTKALPEKQDRVTTDNLKSSDIARQLALGVRKIVIDPGHGGKDPGAPGYIKGFWEKDIVLKLSKNLAEKLRKRLNCEVLLTRTSDKKLTLEERTAIANTQRADLFISMHCNAARNKRLAGIETYILNLATDDQAIAVAARENATSEKNISDLEYILSDLMKHAKIEESTRLANDVHKSMVKGMKKKHSKINDLGVKQAPFYVLLGARMPSILIESSFISNKTECKRLMTQSFRDDICNAITDGVEKYINATNPKHL